MHSVLKHLSAAAGLFLVATPALADPCEAIPQRGPLPSYLRAGKTFSGPVTYVGDGDGLCVAVGPGRREWVEVRLADYYAPELNEPGGRKAKATLERLVKGRQVRCRATGRTYDRVAAECTLRGRPLGQLMRANGAPQGGRGWASR